MKSEAISGRPLTTREKFSYSIGAMGGDMSYGMTNQFFSIYLTDIMKVKPLFLSIMFVAARLWDGINDPMMGTIVQNTKTRMGRFRPWILIGSVVNSIVLILMFINPGLAPGSTGVYVYAAVTYIMWGMSYTMYDIPFWSFIPAITSEPKERNSVSTVTRFFSGFGQALVSLLTVSMVNFFGKGNKATGYFRWAIVLAIIFTLVSLVSVAGSRERYTPQKKERFTFGKAFNVIKSNDQLLAFMCTAILFNTGWYLTTGLGMYYFTHVVGNENFYPVFSALVGVGQMVGLALFPMLSARFTKHNVVKGAIISSMIGYAGMFVLRACGGRILGTVPVLDVEITTGFAAFSVFALIGCMGVGAMFVSQTVMLADVVDYGQFISGERTDSVIFSMKSFLLKIAYTLQSLIMFIGLHVSKYNADNVTKSAKNAISFMMLCIPVILMGCSFLVYATKYRLHGKLYDEVNDAVRAEREKNA